MQLIRFVGAINVSDRRVLKDNKGIRKDVKILRQVRDTETKGAERLDGIMFHYLLNANKSLIYKSLRRFG